MSLLNQLSSAAPGETIVYWTGHLAEDCENKKQAALVARSEAQFALERGLVFLTQKPKGTGPSRVFEYRATRSSRVWR